MKEFQINKKMDSSKFQKYSFILMITPTIIGLIMMCIIFIPRLSNQYNNQYNKIEVVSPSDNSLDTTKMYTHVKN